MADASFLDEVALFEGLEARDLAEVEAALQPRDFDAGDIIVSQGSPGLGFFIIKAGSVDVRRDGKPIAELGPGGFFGEMSLLAERPRTASVVAREPTECMVLLPWDFRELLAKRPEISVKLLRLVCGRAADIERAGKDGGKAKVAPPLDASTLGLLKASPLFAELDEAELADVSRAAKKRVFLAGDTIVTQGTKGDSFFLLTQGSVRVIKDQAALATLEPGAFFGEMSLLADARRSASIVATGHTECLELEGDELKQLLGRRPEIGLQMLEVMSRRLRDTNERLGLD